MDVYMVYHMLREAFLWVLSCYINHILSNVIWSYYLRINQTLNTIVQQRINTNTDDVEIIGNFGVKQYHWHGGAISPKNGAIYAFPSHHSSVLKINTDPECKSDKISLLPIERASHDTETRYKWGGGGVGAGEYLYFLLFYISLSLWRIWLLFLYVNIFDVKMGIFMECHQMPVQFWGRGMAWREEDSHFLSNDKIIVLTFLDYELKINV